MKVGFVGLGIMGSRMARNLISGGYELTVHNRTREKADTLVADGAGWAETPKDLGAAVDVVFTMLADPAAVTGMATGGDGFLEGLKKGTVWVDCSTVDPDFSRQMAQAAKSHGVDLLDIPVVGTKGPAASGELVFLAGGKREAVERCRPLLDCMGKELIYLGDNGQGAAMKMVVNLLLGSAMSAYAEALILGQSLGLSNKKIAEVVLDTPVAAPFLRGKHPLLEQKNYQPHFPLRWMRKDLQLVAKTAYEQNVSLPATNVIKEIYGLAQRSGLGDSDFAAIYQYLSGDVK
ncbi:NAD(P)-dependent oxidoreductase [Desulforhopalus singaporensis]|nr:NAD(P)-dependent oxidoreductase [Desulforhopalus singaporensis]